MMAELILSYFFISNEPLYLRESGQPFLEHEIRLVVKHPINDWFYMNLEPYVAGDYPIVGRAGAKAQIGFKMNHQVSIELHHESVHNLDRNGKPIEIDGVQLRWRLN